MICKHIYLTVLVFLFAGYERLDAQAAALDERTFVRMLLQNHPKARRAFLQQDIGDQELRAAKGMFDPVLAAGFSQKDFQEKLYYRKWDVGMSQPLTWLGMDLAAGVEMNSGSFLNPERNTPLSGLAFAGIRLPLLQGMFIDQRRTDLQLARIFQQRTRLQFQDLNNGLLMDGLKAYWNWNRARLKLDLVREVLANNQVVLQGIRSAFLQGDRPAIDTIEAFQQYQRILLQYNRELVSVQSAANTLNTYLFDNSGQPAPLEESTAAIGFDASLVFVPESQQLARDQNLDTTHPWLALIRNDNERLNTRLRWEKERWKPRLDLQYNFLADNGMSLTEQQFLNENYQVGIKLQYPLLIRNARARTAQVKAGIWQNELAFSEERNRLQNVISALQFNLQNIREQVAMGTIITQNSLQLYQAELTRFNLGESSVFLVNTREIQYLQAQNALIDLRTEEVLTGYSLLHEMGVLFRISEF